MTETDTKPLPPALASTGRRRFLGRGRDLLLSAVPLGAFTGQGRADTGNTDFANPPWLHRPGRPFSNYGSPAAAEKAVIRWVAANPAVPGNGVSWCPLHLLEGSLVPNGLHFERHHHGVPEIDPQRHRLVIHGLVKQALLFDLDSLLRYPMRSRRCFIECGGNSAQGWNSEPTQAAAGHWHGLASCSEWTGVALRLLLEEAGLQPNAGWLIAEGADAFRMNVSIPLAKALDDGLLALYQNGERLRPENGYPLRLLLPGWEGVTQVKWLHRLELSDRPVMARNETARYTELQPDGSARQFSFVMAVKSVITQPSPGYRLDGPGFYEIKGLAWSGRGAIRRVEVSVDGGRQWTEADFDEPPRPHAFTRFRLPWRWRSEPVTLLSRAYDDSGDRQPDRASLIAERGQNGYYHYNAVTAWEIDTSGDVGHVYV